LIAQDDNNLPEDWNDRISSIMIQGGCSVTVYEDADHKGRNKTFTHSEAHLSSFNNVVSSIIIHHDQGEVN